MRLTNITSIVLSMSLLYSKQHNINMFIINLLLPSFKDAFMFSLFHLHFYDHTSISSDRSFTENAEK